MMRRPSEMSSRRRRELLPAAPRPRRSDRLRVEAKRDLEKPLSPEFDVCIVGHVTRDRSNLEEGWRPGGTAYYAGLALQRLGRTVSVVTRVSPADERALLGELRSAGVTVAWQSSRRTSEFENEYPTPDEPDVRIQRLRAGAAAFEPADLAEVRARVYHLGPLLADDIGLDVVRAARALGPVSLDAQGFVRRVEAGRIRPAPWTWRREGLAHVELLKVDAHEAALLTGEHDPSRAARALAAMGPSVCLVTLGSRGSLALAAGVLHALPAVATAHPVDPTGCGDTYAAAYLHCWLDGADPLEAARFASATATAALEVRGAFAGGAPDRADYSRAASIPDHRKSPRTSAM